MINLLVFDFVCAVDAHQVSTKPTEWIINDGQTGSTTADVTVASDAIYVDTATDTATIDKTNGVSFSEAVGIALADVTGTQTLVLKSGLGEIALAGNLAITENLTLNPAILSFAKQCCWRWWGSCAESSSLRLAANGLRSEPAGPLATLFFQMNR